MAKVMMESDRGKEAQKGFSEEVEKKKRDLSAKHDELQKLKDALDKQSAMITQEARAEKEKQFQTKLRDYQKMGNEYEMELHQKNQQIEREMLKDVDQVISQIGAAEKYSLILNRAAVFYAPASADITDKVIARYNEYSKKKGAAPAAKK
jgi:outer membrane protein